METNFETYRDVIRYEFEFRHHKNPSYSLSAFARDLEISKSRLSEILSGKQGLSAERAKIVGANIGYRKEKLQWFCHLVEAESARSPKIKDLAKKRLQYVQNGVATVAVPEDLQLNVKWYHLALRRMTLMNEFREDPVWISSKLGVKPELIRKAIDEMLQTGLLVRDEEGLLSRNTNVHFPASSMSHQVVTRIYKTMYYKAYKARAIPKERRRHGLHFFTLDKEQMADLKDIIQEFEDKLDNLTYKAKKHDEIACLMIAGFPIAEDEFGDKK